MDSRVAPLALGTGTNGCSEWMLTSIDLTHCERFSPCTSALSGEKQKSAKMTIDLT